MNRKILRNPSLLLAGGYAAGQGSMFLTQLVVKHYGYNEMLGIIVILVSIISFALQFIDIGNSTFMVRAITRAENDTAGEFLINRAVVAFFICLLFSWWVFYENKEIAGVVTLLALPIIGAICGGTATAYLEANRNYFTLTVANAMPWLTMSLVSGLTAFFLPAGYIFIVTFASIVAVCSLSLIYTFNRYFRNIQSAPKINLKTIKSVLAFVLPQMGGQIWFRMVIFEINNKLGLIGLGVFGLFRYAQVAMLLILGFMTRPKLQQYIANHNVNNCYRLSDLLFLYKTAFAFSMLGPILWICSMLIVLPTEWAEFVQWTILVAALPITLISIAVSQLNQLTQSFQYIVIVETFCLLMNILVFYLLFSISTGGAIVAGESLGAISNIIIYNFARRRAAT